MERENTSEVPAFLARHGIEVGYFRLLEADSEYLCYERHYRTARMTNERISTDDFHTLTRPLIGLPVSRTWRGYGSAIFFELGRLTERERSRPDGSIGTTMKGESGILIEWSWRVERARSVYFGSWSTNPRITNSLAKLERLTIVDIRVEGRLPELVVQLSGGLWVHSFTTVQSQPQWVLALDGWGDSGIRRFVSSNNGRLHLNTFDSE